MFLTKYHTDLAQLALEMCRDIVSSLSDPNTISEWLAFAHTPSVDYSEPTTPTSSAPSSTPTFQYGAASQTLRSDLMHHITSTLPIQLSAFSTSALPPMVLGAQPNLLAQASSSGTASPQGQAHLTSIYALLPFQLFKSIIESASFPPGDMERFSFAKKCIAERKRVQGKDAAFVETAVLAFGSAAPGSSSNVEIVAKPKKGKTLWKVKE